MLNFLSAYRIPLHKATGSGAYQNVLRLLMGLYISGPNALSARGLAALQPDGVASLLGVSMHSEAPSGIPGVVMGTPRSGDMFEVCTLVCKACNEAGTRLERMGLRDLGELVLRTIKENKSKSDEEKCEAIVAQVSLRVAGQDGRGGVQEPCCVTEAASSKRSRKDGSTFEALTLTRLRSQLVANIPAFADAYLVDGTQPVYLYKKAFFLLEAFARRLSSAGAPSTASLPMFVDNVLPTVLVHARVLDLSNASPALRKWGADPDAKGEEKNQPGPQLRKEDAYAVRAAALDAGTQMVKRAKELAAEEGREWMAKITEADLGE